MDDATRQTLASRFFHEAYELQKKGQLQDAAVLYKKSIESYPTADAYTFLGWAYFMMGRVDDAIEECHRAIEVDPTFGNPYNDIGSYLIHKGQIEEAIPWLERALLAPRYESYCYPHMNLGRVYEAKKQWLRARDEFRKALSENPEYLPAREGISRIQGLLN
jgi:Tfp pilus assembly protein PilF